MPARFGFWRRRSWSGWFALGLLLAGTAYAGQDPSGPNVERVGLAIERGVRFLERVQLPYGEFPLESLEPEGWTFDSTPFATGMILYNLLAVDHERVHPMASRAIEFLLHEMSPPGLWRFWSTKNPYFDQRVVPDIEDTSVIGLTLLRYGVTLPDLLDRLLARRTTEGLFQTWMVAAQDLPPMSVMAENPLMRTLGPHYLENTPDCVQNTHALAYVAHQGSALSEVCVYLSSIVATHADPTACSLYYIYSPYPFAYGFSKAYVEGARCLRPAVQDLVAQIIGQQRADGSWGTALDTALAAGALLNLGYIGSPLEHAVAWLLHAQESDGSWPRAAYYGSKKKPGAAYGSAALTTGFVLEVLGRFRERH